MEGLASTSTDSSFLLYGRRHRHAFQIVNRRSAGRLRNGRRLIETLAQQAEETLLRHWRSNQNALPEVATHHQHGLQIDLRFNAFGNCRAAEAVREIERGLSDRGMGRIGRAMLDEAGVELELRE